MQCCILWLCLGKQIKWNLISPQSCSTPTPKLLLLLPEEVWCGPRSSLLTSLRRSHDCCPETACFFSLSNHKHLSQVLLQSTRVLCLSSALQREAESVLMPQAATATPYLEDTVLSGMVTPSGFRCISSFKCYQFLTCSIIIFKKMG